MEIIILTLFLVVIFIIFSKMKQNKTHSIKKMRKQNNYTNTSNNYCSSYSVDEENYVDNRLANKYNYKLALLEEGFLQSKMLLGFQELEIYKQLIHNEFLKKNFTIFAQVSMKAFIKPTLDGDNCWKSYSDFCVDFLLTEKIFSTSQPTAPLCVLEFHGSGHYGDTLEQEERAKNNDEIKKRVLEKANIGLYIINGENIYTNKKYIDKKKLEIEITKFQNFLEDFLQ